MIPKPLSDIEWSDIEALRDSGREEDDTIEYKGSFSGGSDFLAFNDSKRAKAIEGIAREAVAFMNGRGGDIIIGVREAANEHPKIEEITPIDNIDQTSDRLAQSLAALIEPTQSILGLRAIRQSKGDADGVIVVRCPSSLRAPHRFTPNKECYIRRGRASVPMPMDEVQDVTLNRTMRRSERLELVDRQFETMDIGRVALHQLPARRFHIKTAFVPFPNIEVELDDATLSAFQGANPELYYLEHKLKNDVVFRSLNHSWTTVLRGRSKEFFHSKLNVNGLDEFGFAEKSIRRNLTMTTDFACCRNMSNSDDMQLDIHAEWLVGYLSNTIDSFRRVMNLHPIGFPGLLRTVVFHEGEMGLLVGNNFPHRYELIAGISHIPDFEISSQEEFNDVFQQLQVDVYSLAGIQPPQIWSMNPPE